MIQFSSSDQSRHVSETYKTQAPKEIGACVLLIRGAGGHF